METIAGRFRINRWLGEGVLGSLYHVEQLGTSVWNTLRVLPPGSAGSQAPPAPKKGTATRFRHPNIIPVEEVGTTPEGQVFILMEYAAGTTLAEIASRGAVPRRWALEITRQLIAGLRATHEDGRIHGTLTPESVVIGSTPDNSLTVGILDLGLSPLFRRQGCAPDPRYASPEVLAGAIPDELSDVFSVGAVAYHLVTGAPVGTEPEDPNTLPPALATVLATAVSLEPEYRFRNMAQFGEALELGWVEPPMPSTAVEAASAFTAPAAEAARPRTRARIWLAPIGMMAAAVALMLWLYRPTATAVNHSAPTGPLRVAPENPAAGTQWARLPDKSAPDRTKSGTAAASKPTKRKITSPTLLPGQGYKAGLAREDVMPAERAPAAEPPTPVEAAPPPAEPVPEVESQPAPTAETPAAPAPSAAPSEAAAAATAEAGMAEARAAAASAVSSYARAIETNDVEALRRVYPGLTEQERSAWKEFFAAARDLKAELSIKSMDVKGQLNQVQVTGIYEYANRSLNRLERKPVSFRATLTRGPEGWRLSEVR